MKKIKYYIFGALASIAALTSCDADFTEINKNPDTVCDTVSDNFCADFMHLVFHEATMFT